MQPSYFRESQTAWWIALFVLQSLASMVFASTPHTFTGHRTLFIVCGGERWKCHIYDRLMYWPNPHDYHQCHTLSSCLVASYVSSKKHNTAVLNLFARFLCDFQRLKVLIRLAVTYAVFSFLKLCMYPFNDNTWNTGLGFYNSYSKYIKICKCHMYYSDAN